ncbi:hypothetical protein L596_005530 [Steinernema carpocapsae]|uniref:GRAM domain-containing protein n=1 Tax=Steinernema carpocapsae TaxID=34508 RepID=A0A4U8UZB0_STECR|nr:hypothetical protein L596_005530 [Steinernema carpocapsae]
MMFPRSCDVTDRGEFGMDPKVKRPPKAMDEVAHKNGVNHLMDVLMKNYDIVSVLADFERPDTPVDHLPLSSRHSHNSALHDASNLKKTPDLSDHNTRNPHSGGSDNDMTEPHCNGWWSQWSASLKELCAEVVEALSENSDDVKAVENEHVRFSAHALSRDIKRCLTSSHGYLETGVALRELQMWKNPLVTLSLFFVYFYSVFRGWLLSLFFFVILLQLSINYLQTQKNINLGLNFLPRKELPVPKLDISGAQLVFDIARRAQILFKLTADVLEKLNSLFMWKRPDTTLKFFVIMLVFFLATSLFSGTTCATIVMVALGGKAFITTYLFNRFPKLRQKFDIIVHFFDRLPVLSDRHSTSPRKMLSPTHNVSPLHSPNSLTVSHGHVKKSRSMLSIASMGSRPRRGSLEESHGVAASSSESNLLLIASESQQNVIQIQTPERSSPEDSDSLQSEEQGIEIQRECYLCDTDKFFPISLIPGNLILNDICLIFKSTKADKSDLYIPFDEVVSVRKSESSRSLKLIPTSRRSLEINLKNRKKPYVFKGISKRDQFYESLLDTMNCS